MSKEGEELGEAGGGEEEEEMDWEEDDSVVDASPADLLLADLSSRGEHDEGIPREH